MAVRPIALGDEVKHLVSKEGSIAGTVIAIYPVNRQGVITTCLDVRVGDNRIYYGTPAANWETTIPVEELE